MLIKWDNWRICNKPWEANSSLSGLTYIFRMSTVSKMKHFEGFKLLRIFTVLWPVLIEPWNWSKHAFGKWEKPPFQTKRKCEAEKVQMNVGIWKRKDCIHYSHQGCTGNMNSSNYKTAIYFNRFLQWCSLMLMYFKWWMTINLCTS